MYGIGLGNQGLYFVKQKPEDSLRDLYSKQKSSVVSSSKYKGAGWMVGNWDEDLDTWGPNSWPGAMQVGNRPYKAGCMLC